MSNSNLTQVIKQIARDEREASKPADIVPGTVEKTSPLTVRVSPKLALTGETLMTTYTAAHSDLAPGDRVVLIRAQGGQRFLVVDKLA